MRRALVMAVPLLAMALAGCSGPGPPPAPTEVIALHDHEGSHFEPPLLAASVGKPVPFRVVSGNHTVDFALGEGPVSGVSKAHSGPLGPGDTFSVSFERPGVYRYFCRLHSLIGPDAQRTGMQGAIQVT